MLRTVILAISVVTSYAFTCPEPDGLFAQAGNCQEFHHCTGGRDVRKPCPKGLYFDDWRKVCNWKSDALCGPLPANFQGPTTTLGPTNPPLCPQKGTVPCSSQDQCIPATALCNGVRECRDGSDEVYCPHVPNQYTAGDCDPRVCKLPRCYCNARYDAIPRASPNSKKPPQMIVISTSGPLSEHRFDKIVEFYNKGYTNPNGCPIQGTHFLSHGHTNYHLVDLLQSKGAEIAIESVSQSVPQLNWQTASREVWLEEIAGLQSILQRFSNVVPTGARAPFLQTGGDEQYDALQVANVRYDASIQNNYYNEPSWPFTLDYKLPFERCTMYRCPYHKHAGLWEVPLNQLINEQYRPCVVLDQCYNEGTELGAFEFLRKNFERHYYSNRGPLSFVVGEHWLNSTAHLSRALQRFFQYIVNDKAKFNDVWFVSSNEVVNWMAGTGEVYNHSPGSKVCKKQKEAVCSQPNSCLAQLGNEKREMVTCKACPTFYPWVDNPLGDHGSVLHPLLHIPKG